MAACNSRQRPAIRPQRSLVSAVHPASVTSILELRRAVFAARRLLAATRHRCEEIAAQAAAAGAAEADRLQALGYQQGYAAGCESAQTALFDKVSASRRIVESAHAAVQRHVLAIAEAVLGTAVSLQPQSICERVERALSQCAAETAVSVFANPADLPYLQRASNRLQHAARCRPPLRYCEDAHLARGEARIEAGGAVIISSVPEHLRAIKRYLEREGR